MNMRFDCSSRSLLEDLNLRHNEVRASGPISRSIHWHSQGVSQGKNIDQCQLKQAIRPPVIPSCDISSGLTRAWWHELQVQIYRHNRHTMTHRERERASERGREGGRCMYCYVSKHAPGLFNSDSCCTFFLCQFMCLRYVWVSDQ